MSTGAFLWKDVWTALQTGPIWGYESVPFPLILTPGPDRGQGLDRGPSKRWTLALCEGPERGCIQMHQDCCSVGTVEDKESAHSRSERDRGSSPTNSASTAAATDGTHNTAAPGKSIINTVFMVAIISSCLTMKIKIPASDNYNVDDCSPRLLRITSCLSKCWFV